MLNRALEAGWRTGWLPFPDLNPATLTARARQSTGLDDFGSDDSWASALELLTAALVSEARLNAVGRTIAYGQLVGILRQRLRAQALWQAHPEILDLPMAAPVIVLGQMRSGTTRLQRLLACDLRFAHTRFFESWNPVPRNRQALLDDRKVRTWTAIATAKLLNPRFFDIHPTSAFAVDEEIGFHSFSLCGAPFETQWHVPSFARAWEHADLSSVYREFRALLQTIAWLRGEHEPRPWVLKVPQFTQDLPAVLAAFPGARLLYLKRDPVAVVGSSASLAHNQMQLQSDDVDPLWIGREWLRKVAHRQAISERFLAEHPDVPVLRLSSEAMDKDWRVAVADIYEYLGMPLCAAVRHRMTRYLKAGSDQRRSRHRYNLDDYGLTREMILRMLA